MFEGRRWWVAFIILAVVVGLSGWSTSAVRALMLGSAWVCLAYLTLDAFVLRSERIGTVRWNKRALHTARKNLANGEGGGLRVWWLRVRLYLALRARRDR